jgi:hypothetical protein
MRDFFKGSLGCLPMLLCLGGCVYLTVNKIERTNQDRIEAFSEGKHIKEVIIKDIDRIIRHTSGHYTLLKEQGDQPVETFSLQWNLPRDYNCMFHHNNQPQNRVFTDVAENDKPWAVQRYYKTGGQSFDLHLHTVKQIQGGEHHYRVKVQKHWQNRVQESEVME